MNVSVIIPCYNAQRWLAQTIGSVLDQDTPPAEVIVVDDGSTDDSLAIARDFESRFPERVRVVSQRSGRAAATRNIGARLAKGDALMFLDADDVLRPDALTALVTALADEPEGIALCPWYRLELWEGRWVKRPASCRRRNPRHDVLSNWLVGWYHPPCSVLWSRAAYERVGSWDERATVNDDGEIMMRALTQQTPVTLTTAGAAFYRRLPETQMSLSGQRFTRPGLENRLYVIEKIAGLLTDAGRLKHYRASVSEAFRLIAVDAAEAHPDVRARAEALTRQYAPPAWQRLPRRALHAAKRGARRFHNALRRRISAMAHSNGAAQTTAQQDEPIEEIHYGLAHADVQTGEREPKSRRQEDFT